MIYKPEDFINSIYYDTAGFVWIRKFQRLLMFGGGEYYEFLYSSFDEPYKKEFKNMQNHPFNLISSKDIPKKNLLYSFYDHKVVYIGYAETAKEAVEACKGYFVFQ